MRTTADLIKSVAVEETTTTTGTGSYLLNGPTAGYFAFSDAYSDGDSITYRVWDGPNVEIVTGIFDSSTNTLSRDIVLVSSAQDTLVNWSANTRRIIRPLRSPQFPDAVFFDGFEGSYYTTALSGVTNSALLSFSFWVKADQNFQSHINLLVTDYSGNFPGGIYWRFGDGDLEVTISEVPSGNLGIRSHMVVPVDGQFHNILGAVDATTSSSIGVFYVDETIQENFFIRPGPLQLQSGAGGFAIPDFPAAGSGAQIHVGARGRGCLGDLWWAPGQFIDFSLSVNRAKFHNVISLAPVSVASLGTSGQIPTGVTAAVFLTGGKSAFGNNLGSGGALTATAVVENCLDGLHVSLPSPATTKGGIRFGGEGQQLVYYVGVNYTSVSLQVDSPTGLLSVWLRIDALPTSGTFTALFAAINNTTRIIDISLNSNGRVRAEFTAIDGTTTATFTQVTGGFPADGSYHHLMFSWNTQVGTAQAVVDRNIEAVTRAGSAGFDVGISMTDGHASAFNTAWSALSREPAGQPGTIGDSLTGDAAELWVSIKETLDLSSSLNIDKFEIGGHPTDLGVDGSTPTGIAPFAYHSQQPQTYEAITFYFDRAIPLGLDSTGFGVTSAFTGFGNNFPSIAPAPYP